MQSEKERVREIVRRWGWNATAYQILNPGFTYWIDEQRNAAAGYITRAGVRVVGGVPISPRAQFTAAIQEFEADAQRAGEGVIYFGAERRLAALARKASDRIAFTIGAQPVWRPGTLLDEFRVHSSLRAQLNRSRNKGVAVRALSGTDDPANQKLHRCLKEWIETRGLPAMHFLIETETLRDLIDRKVLVAERDGEPVGFLVLTPIPARKGWLVEQIVRGRAAPNGTNELLLYSAAELVANDHADLITLGLAPLAERARPLVNRAPKWLFWLLKGLRAHGRHFYNFEGLEAFKAKFGRSRWDTVYASLSPGTSLARALIAVSEAFLLGA